MVTAVIETTIPDLDEVSLGDLQPSDDRLQAHVRTLFRQVNRPRTNLGGSAPPGHTY